MAKIDQSISSKQIDKMSILAKELVVNESIMTLATAQDNVPWAAPVYYVYHNSLFYFFSDLSSRHIRESMKSGLGSSAIFATTSTWKDIRGIQMMGNIKKVSHGIKSLRVINAYIKKFSFMTDFIQDGEKINLHYFKKYFQVHLFEFKPNLIHFVDNQISFGTQYKITL